MEAPTVDADGTAITKRWLALTSAWTEGPVPRRILAELAIVVVDLALATLVGAALDRLGLGADAIVIVYVLAVQVVSLATASHVVCGVVLDSPIEPLRVFPLAISHPSLSCLSQVSSAIS